ncbi:MAG: hypothetical protein QGG63_00455 [Candidatus Pacebacteria bacterium]|jgi:Holliday junction resolvasome RuvABC DNA-binding subunit|nr:hypothetical protein [Candidatus Paceibacterota bacterium]|tara:strand:- start:1579 stop:1947 length:369 start_codon:yes stop_codon:yes gene_type:complete
MTTFKQKRLAEEIINNSKKEKPFNKSQLLETAGYSRTVAQATPQKIIEQKGVKEELKLLGFDEGNAKKVVSEIMLNSKEDSNTRLRATDQVFKVAGSYVADKTRDKPINIAMILNQYKKSEI